jgi:hypothetical protein
MKSMEIDSFTWSEEQREQAFAKLQELGYKPFEDHGKEGFNGKMSISACAAATYYGFDSAPCFTSPNDLTPTFEELMNYTKEDVQ